MFYSHHYHNVASRCNSLQEFVLKKLVMKGKVEIKTVGKAQIKIMVIILYDVFLGVVGLVTYTYYSSDSFRTAITEYILCKSGGVESSCTSPNLNLGVETLSVVSIMMFSLLPVVILAVSINPSSIRKGLSKNFHCCK